MSAANVLDLFRLEGRVALVTGGSRGLGQSIALGLSQAGCRTVLVARDETVGRAAAARVTELGGTEARFIAADVTVEEQARAAVESAVEIFGRLDVLVNSAGLNIRHPIEEFPLAEFRQVLDINLTGTWLMCRAVAPLFKALGGGSAINLGSALSAVALPERTAYCSSKAAVVGLTRALALEWAACGARCNAICPGPFLTEMNEPLLADPAKVRQVVGNTALDRWAELHEIRGAALFLASDASTYVTGTTLYVDGGWTAR